jgi:hypothetical protein
MLSSKVLFNNCSFTRVVLLFLSSTVFLINCMYIVGTRHHEKPFKQCKCESNPQCKCESNPQYSFRRKKFLGNHFKVQAEMTNVLKYVQESFQQVAIKDCDIIGLTPLIFWKVSDDPDGTRTHNPQLRRLMPYPLGHWATISR